MFDLVVKDGTIVNGSGVYRGDVAVDGSKIAAVGKDLRGRRELDAHGCYVLPGAVDAHVHLQMSLDGRVSADSFEGGTVAAAYGGTTTVIDFVDPKPTQSMLDAFWARRREADGNVAVDYGLHMTVPAWHAAAATRLEELPMALDVGCATFKLYQAYEGMALDDVSLLRVLQSVGRIGGRAVLHSEISPVLEVLRGEALAEGHTAPIWHARTRPARLEGSAVQRAAELASVAKCPLYVFHVGCREVVEELRAARGRGVEIWAETCPQYLLLTAEEHLAGATGELYVCAPPLRTEADQSALWAALAQGDVAVVSTDHCPWTKDEKSQADFTKIPGGVPSIEGRLALIYEYGVRAGQLSLERWVQVCCTEPARLMGLSMKGLLAPGYDADVVVFDAEREKQLTPRDLHETAGWTPYEDVAVTGWPRSVILGGRIIVENEEYRGVLDGKFVARTFGPFPKNNSLRIDPIRHALRKA